MKKAVLLACVCLIAFSQVSLAFFSNVGFRLISRPTCRYARTLSMRSAVEEDMAALAELKTAAQTGNAQKAISILQQLQEKKVRPTSVHYNRALKASSKDFAQMEKILNEMREVGVEPDDVTFNTVIKAHYRADGLDKAIHYFELARSQGLLEDTIDHHLYDSMIGAYRRSDQLAKAMQLCEEMRSKRMDPTREGYAFIAVKAINDSKTYLISRTLETMKQEGFPAEDIEYVRKIIVDKLPEELKYQVDGPAPPKK